MQLVDCLLVAEVIDLHFVVLGLDGLEELAVLDAFELAEVGLVELLGVEVVPAVVESEVGSLGDGDPGSFALEGRWVSGAYFWVSCVRGGTRLFL